MLFRWSCILCTHIKDICQSCFPCTQKSSSTESIWSSEHTKTSIMLLCTHKRGRDAFTNSWIKGVVPSRDHNEFTICQSCRSIHKSPHQLTLLEHRNRQRQIMLLCPDKTSQTGKKMLLETGGANTKYFQLYLSRISLVSKILSFLFNFGRSSAA